MFGRNRENPDRRRPNSYDIPNLGTSSGPSGHRFLLMLSEGLYVTADAGGSLLLYPPAVASQFLTDSEGEHILDMLGENIIPTVEAAP